MMTGVATQTFENSSKRSPPGDDAGQDTRVLKQSRATKTISNRRFSKTLCGRHLVSSIIAHVWANGPLL